VSRWHAPFDRGAPCYRVRATVTVECQLISEIGPLLRESLRSQLEAYPERRTQERVAWPHPVRATFLLADNKPGETLEGRGKDISLGGMGLYLPRAHAG